MLDKDCGHGAFSLNKDIVNSLLLIIFKVWPNKEKEFKDENIV